MLDEYAQEQIDQQRLFMLNQDPPEHTRTRQLVNRGFTPRMIARLEERIQQNCDDIVEQALAKAEGDFVTLCAAELPLIVIAELMGVPIEDRHKVFDWSNRMVGGNDPEYGVTEEQRFSAAQEMWAYANELAKHKREQLKDDIVSKLISPDDEGNVLSELEFDLFFMLLAVAGNETTRNAISGGMYALTQHPEQWDRLKADPALVPSAVAEVLRWKAPVQGAVRQARLDVELGGQAVAAGDKLILLLGAANRDPSVFPDPDVFDVGRFAGSADPQFTPVGPMRAFGGGEHTCSGSLLAKLEMELALEHLLDRVGHMSFAGDPPVDAGFMLRSAPDLELVLHP
jgi:cholest-4-en-3-one 26-monooxygenase